MPAFRHLEAGPSYLGVPGYGLGSGPVCFGDRFGSDFEFGLLPNPLTDLKSRPCIDFWITFCTCFQIAFCTGLYFDYRPTAFPSICCQVYPGCSAGLWQSPQPSGMQHIEPPHKIVEGLISFCFQECLWPQQRMSTFAAYPEGRRGSLRLPFSFSLLCKRGTLVLYSEDTHYGTRPSILFGMCGTLPGARWIDLPQNWVLLHCLGSPGGTFVVSFCPHDTVCKNISWRITAQCGDPMFHQGYSSKKRSAFTISSAFLKEIPSCSALWWAS